MTQIQSEAKVLTDYLHSRHLLEFNIVLFGPRALVSRDGLSVLQRQK